MKKIEVIVLAGGLGTRLRSVVQDLPKPMAPVNGKPFLSHLLKQIDRSLISKFIFAVGYKHDTISHYFGNSFLGIPIEYSIENEPLGTGGGIKQALEKVQSETCLIINGDTYLDFSVAKALSFHQNQKSDFTIVLKKMYNPYRYGTVTLNGYQIVEFNEKDESLTEGIINAGAYLIETKYLQNNLSKEEKFSFETAFLEKEVKKMTFFGFITQGDFVDIGIPEDYHLFQKMVKLRAQQILFLDRDGVLNVYHHNDYVKHPAEFQLIDGVLDSLKILRDYYDLVYVITNQQGLGKEIMIEKNLEDVHLKFYETVKSHQSFFPTVLYAPYLKEKNHPWRKPENGMINYILSLAVFPNNNVKTTVCGDAPTDMELARKINATAVRIENPLQNCEDYDFSFVNLSSFAQFLIHQ
jgi:D-glycero-alpha-D-manno-heptose 1-phosphate guanylyltransferase